MSNVIKVNFPKKSIRKYPRQRVFYIGQYYCGPPLCQSLQKLWLKRKPNNRWVFLEYHYGRAYEHEEYDGDDPWIEGVEFSAFEYAEIKIKEVLKG